MAKIAPGPPEGDIPAEMVAWVGSIKLAPAHKASFLTLLCGDEWGLTTPNDFGTCMTPYMYMYMYQQTDKHPPRLHVITPNITLQLISNLWTIYRLKKPFPK